LKGYVEDSDVKAAAVLPEVDGKEEEPLRDNWDFLTDAVDMLFRM
jgi:hypothetical protein